MANLHLVKTNFTAGEISPQLLGRGDLRAYENGAKTLKNVSIHPTGGLTRRRGTYFIDQAYGAGRLISFEFNSEQHYVLVVTALKICIYRAGLKVIELASPWDEEQIQNLTWTQSADTILFCHPDVIPKKLTRLSDTVWTLQNWKYTTSSTNRVTQPYYKYADDDVTVTPTATTGLITVSSSVPIFTTDHVGTRLRIKNKEVEIYAYYSSTIVTANVIETLTDTNPTIDWQEQAFSVTHGYPQCAAFHQDRLVIGGSRDLPNRLWMSCSGDLWNFEKGTGLDNEGIEFGLFSDQINTIRALFSGRHLQVFTSGAEWIVTGSPLTPSSIQLNRQTRIGAVMTRYIPPVDVDGATLFVGRTAQDLREFIYADVEQAYQANDLALLSRHLFLDPVDQCFDPYQRILYLPLADGTMSALTIYRTESVFAWSRVETDGQIISAAMVGKSVYLLIKRHDDLHYIERIDEEMLLDCALSGTTVNPALTWSGLDHLDGRTVQVIADGIVQNDKTVVAGQITLDQAARSLTVGLRYSHLIEPLPPSTMTLDGAGRTLRLVRAVFRLQSSQALTVDIGRGLKDVTLRQSNIMNQPPAAVTGDISIRSYGWSADGTKPLWRLEQDVPLPCTILSVTMELKVNE